MQVAPIALFVYNRLWHTKQTVDALRKNTLAAESDLIVYSDGPRTDDAVTSVNAVRSYIGTVEGFKSVKVIIREKNLGLARSIISGVTEAVNSYGRIIVLEDDLITSPYFLKYMNDGLTLYELHEKVISIHGYVYPIKKPLPETFFLRGADCWGWATWKRGWDLFEPDGKKLYGDLKKKRLLHEFDFYGSYPYVKMLKKQIAGKNDSWAIRWYASAFINEKLTLYPGRSLVHNIGMDNSGTHCGPLSLYAKMISETPINLNIIPHAENVRGKKAIAWYFRFLFLRAIGLIVKNLFRSKR